MAAKKKFKAAGGGFGAAPREKKRSEKPFKSQVVDAHNGFEKWRDDEAADVWIASRAQPTRWWLAGYAACKSGCDVAGATTAQKALIYKMGVTLDRSLEQAPDGLIAATAPSSRKAGGPERAADANPAPCCDSRRRDEYGYEPKVYRTPTPGFRREGVPGLVMRASATTAELNADGISGRPRHAAVCEYLNSRPVTL